MLVLFIEVLILIVLVNDHVRKMLGVDLFRLDSVMKLKCVFIDINLTMISLANITKTSYNYRQYLHRQQNK